MAQLVWRALWPKTGFSRKNFSPIAAITAVAALFIYGEWSHASNDITVAVASNFQRPMKALVAEFQRQQPQQNKQKVKLVFGASGQLWAQIKQGAPFDAFYAADQSHPERLSQSLAVRHYATGRLVLISQQHDSPKVLLLANEPRTLAIANPKLAPYGAAAIDVLEALQPAPAPKLITSSNISRAALHSLRGTTDLGFIALADLPKDWPQEKQWPVPAHLHRPIEQYAALLAPAAEDFFRFTLSPKAQSIIQQYGYE